MQRSTVLFLLLGCTVAALVGWTLFSDAGGEVVPPGGGGPVAPDDGGASQPGEGPAPFAGAVPADAPRVRVRVTSLERFVAPPPEPDLAVRVDGVALPARIIAGVGAGFDVTLARRGVALLAIEHDGGELLRQLALDPTSPTPARVGARIVVRGRVNDGRQRPVRGARVWFGELHADGSERSFVVDDEGAFEADVPAGDGVPFVVRATGYASKWRAISVGPDVQPLDEVLQPATTVYLQVAARAVEIERARAFVVPLSSGVSSGLSQWPFFAQLLADGYPVDGSGRVAIEDLPQHGEVGVVVRHPLAPLMAPEVVELSEQPARALVRMSFASRTHQGGVVDDAGAPIAGASLWARVPGQRLDGPRSQRLLPPYLDLRGACAARAGADGRFSIGLPDAEDAQLAVRARGFAGRNVPWSSEMDAELVLPVWRGGDASLRVQPPVAGAVWRVDSNLGGGVDLPCAADEACVLALPYCGRFDVQLRVEVAGAEPVVREVTGLLVTGPVELTTDGG